jgi:hypothetical protein
MLLLSGAMAAAQIPDPAAVAGAEEERRRAFARAFRELGARIKLFTSLRIDALDELSLQRQLDAIGKTAEPVDQRDDPAVGAARNTRATR